MGVGCSLTLQGWLEGFGQPDIQDLPDAQLIAPLESDEAQSDRVVRRRPHHGFVDRNGERIVGMLEFQFQSRACRDRSRAADTATPNREVVDYTFFPHIIG